MPFSSNHADAKKGWSISQRVLPIQTPPIDLTGNKMGMGEKQDTLFEAGRSSYIVFRAGFEW